MKSQSGKSLIERVLQWLRGMWEESNKRWGARESESGAAGQSAGTPPARPAGEDAATGATGASEDEFATGGYTPDNPDLEDVESAADGPPGQTPSSPPDGDERERDRSGTDRESEDGATSLVDQEMRQPTPPSGNYGVGNLGLGSRGSLGGATAAAASAEASTTGPDRTGETGNDSGITDESGSATASGGVPRPDEVAASPGMDTDLGGPGTSGAGAASTFDDPTVRGIGDLGPEELGSLEELDEDAIAFEEDAREEYDPNSSPGFAADVPDTLADIDYETDDYTSTALEDAGMRIVDEDNAGLTEREPATDEFVNPGLVLDDDLNDTDDARPLGDFTQTRSGIASESDERAGTAGERSSEPFGSETGMATTETWSEESSNEDLGEAGELEALDFGETPAAAGIDDEESLAPSDSDIDVADLSYLDEAENARYEFANAAPEPPGDVGVDSDAGVADDIAVSPSGVRDEGGAIESDLTSAGETPTIASAEGDDIPDSASGVADDIAVSPTGVVDAEATTDAIEDAGQARQEDVAAVPLMAAGDPASTTSGASPASSGPGGSVRGDGTGSCPADFPIKGNSSSKIFHVPGIPSYDGTKAEWCFATEEQAAGAGYRPPGQRNRGGGGASSGPNAGRTSSRGRSGNSGRRGR